ncbi:hypothetical protein JOH51_002778 [Rhizobium leguminosarum]|nr:hypothetical protein [Rhizobium leguminosarum]
MDRAGQAHVNEQNLVYIRNAYAVALDVFAFDDDIAEIDADPELQPVLRQGYGVVRGFPLLSLHRATQGIDDALEFDQQTIAHGFDQPAVVTLDRRLEDIALVRLKTRTRTLFLDLAQSTVTDDIGDQDSCKTALHPRFFLESEGIVNNILQ